MITELEIQNFRGFKNLKLEGFRRVNLLVGSNDTGKTSILEALLLLLGDHSILNSLPVALRNNQNDGALNQTQDDFESYWMWLFRERNPANAIRLKCTIGDGKTVEVESKQMPGNPVRIENQILSREFGSRKDVLVSLDNRVSIHVAGFGNGIRISRLSVRPTHPVQDAEKYNLVALNSDGEKRVETMMRVIEPRLRRLRYSKIPNTSSPLVYADIGLFKAVPSTQMGQAFNRLLNIYCEILSQKVDVLLIDEIENGIFSDFLPTIWKGLLAICEEEDVQIFATTHSRECVMAAFASAGERAKEELAVYRVQRVKGEIESVRLEARHLEMAAEMGLEVRS